MALQPVLTIITPVFNGEDFIAETILSVLDAPITIPYEYIVLDDGSTDSTAAILNQFSDRIKILSHSNMGESKTVNHGLEKALGEYILIINADDPLVTENLLYKAIEVLGNNPEVVAVYPDWKIIDEHGTTIKNMILPNYSDEVMIGQCRCLPGPGTVFRKNAAISIGGRDAKWKFVSDYDFWLRLSRFGKILRLPEILAQWRKNPDSISISQRGQQMATERIEVIKNFCSNHYVPPKLMRTAIGNSYYLAARLVFFDSGLRAKFLLYQAFKKQRGWPTEAKLHVILYIVLMPLSKLFIWRFPKIVKKIGRG